MFLTRVIIRLKDFSFNFNNDRNDNTNVVVNTDFSVKLNNEILNLIFNINVALINVVYKIILII